jgi:hypothetical protein
MPATSTTPIAAVPWPAAAALAERMTRLAGELEQQLDPQQRRLALHPFAGPARLDWGYTPRRRPGLPLRAMRPAQRSATWRLVDAALSAEGAAKARGVLALEVILREREPDKAYRDPENYALALFGLPGSEPWGWRFEGHHLSLTLTIVPEVGVAVTPHFLGANPFSGEVVHGAAAHGRLTRVLEQESALAFELVGGLDAPLLRRAVIAADRPADILAGPGRERLWGGEPEGLPLEAMPESLRNRAHALIEAFFGHLAPELAAAVAARVRAAGLGAVRFAWAGATTPDRLHYYRLHGPTLLIEYDRTGPDHAHSVWHDPSDPFGEDQLRAHHESAHRDG